MCIAILLASINLASYKLTSYIAGRAIQNPLLGIISDPHTSLS